MPLLLQAIVICAAQCAKQAYPFESEHSIQLSLDRGALQELHSTPEEVRKLLEHSQIQLWIWNTHIIDSITVLNSRSLSVLGLLLLRLHVHLSVRVPDRVPSLG